MIEIDHGFIKKIVAQSHGGFFELLKLNDYYFFDKMIHNVPHHWKNKRRIQSHIEKKSSQYI